MIKQALEALTSPNPSDQQVLIIVMVDWMMRRFPEKRTGDKTRVAYGLMVLARYGLITNKEMPRINPKAYEVLVNTIVDAWSIKLQEKI